MVIDKVYIRADGASHIGLGHIVRCIALSQMLKSDFSITFFSKYFPEKLKSTFDDENIDLKVISTENDFLSILSGKEIVVLDHYELDSEYQKSIKRIGNKLVCIDDLHDKKFYADLIINQTPGTEIKDYVAQPYTKFALGLEYALLRESFLNFSQSKKFKNKEANSVLICFGGSDVKNFTESVLNNVIKRNEFQHIYVILGASFQNAEGIKKIANQEINNIIKIYQNAPESLMFDILAKVELAIVPSSSILLEALSTNCVVISGYYVNNQKHNYQFYKKNNYIIDAFDFNKEALSNALKLYSNKQYFPENKLIDGFSGKRIRNLFVALKLEIRPATIDDCDLFFNWANDSRVRENAFNSEKIILENHVKWYKNKIASNDAHIFVLEREDTPIGQIRFERENDYLTIDYSVDKDFRGYRLGHKVIEFGLREVKGLVKAFVKDKNEPSKRVFRKLGFSEKYIDENTIEYNIEVK